MTDTIDLTDIDPPAAKPDFRRANGAPMVIIEGRNERFSRPSSFGKVLDDESALTNWRINKAIAGTARHKDLIARASAAKEDDRSTWAKLRDDCIAAGRGAESADIGTALHAMSERWEDPEDDFDPPDDFRLSLEAYTEQMTRLGLTSEMMEFQTVNVEYRAAGTCDRLYRLTRSLETPSGKILRPGTLVIGDLKTGGKLEFSLPGYAIQMAIYAQGQFYDVVNDVMLPTPDINQDWAIIVHMPAKEPGVCEMLWVDLEQGNYGAWLGHEVRKWRYDWRAGRNTAPEIGDPLPEPDGVVAMLRENLGPVAEVDQVAWIKLRVAAFRADDAAAQRLRFSWPDGVPAPAGLSEPEHIEQVLKLLDRLETQFQLAFIPPPTLP